MPLTLVPPKPGRTPNYRIRGIYLGVRVDRSAETRDRAKAQKLLAAIEAAIERGAFAPKPTLTLAAAITAYVKAGGEDRFLAPILCHFGKGATVEEIDQIAADNAAAAIYPKATSATRNRQFYTPLLAVLHRANVETKIERPI